MDKFWTIIELMKETYKTYLEHTPKSRDPWASSMLILINCKQTRILSLVLFHYLPFTRDLLAFHQLIPCNGCQKGELDKPAEETKGKGKGKDKKKAKSKAKAKCARNYIILLLHIQY
jgi:hypothetical protein